MSLLLDTCAVIWITNDEKLSIDAVEALDQAVDTGSPTFISPITAWEIGLLVARGRLALPVAPQAWFDRLTEAPNLRLADMPPAILIASAFLPGDAPRDPADRILVATSRTFGLPLVTRDKALLSYAAAGHVKTIAC
jgi:PIN domain nuclease of toxin-antitoxin system